MTVGATTVYGNDPSPEAAFAAIARHGHRPGTGLGQAVGASL